MVLVRASAAATNETTVLLPVECCVALRSAALPSAVLLKGSQRPKGEYRQRDNLRMITVVVRVEDVPPLPCVVLLLFDVATPCHHTTLGKRY
jgi:hypothetical protein